MKTFFRITGWALLALGGILIVAGLLSDVTVYSPGRYAPYAGFIEGARMVNFQRMFSALALLVTGGFVLVTGSVFAIGGEMLPAIATTEPSTEPPVFGRQWPAWAAGLLVIGLLLAGAYVLTARRLNAEPPRAEITAADAAAMADGAATAAEAAASEAEAAVAETRPRRPSAAAAARAPERRPAKPSEVAEINARLAAYEQAASTDQAARPR